MIFQVAWTIDQIVLMITLLLIYAVFLGYELFKRKEKLEYMAYLAATIPFAYIWAIGNSYLGSVTILFILWTICLVRDLVLRYVSNKKDHDYANAIILFAVSIGVFFLYAAIMPALFPAIKARSDVQGFGNMIWLPILDVADSFLNPWRIVFTIDVFLCIVPVIVEIKMASARVGVWPNIFLAIGFTLPTVYLMYVWILDTGALFVLGLLIGVVYFIILLLLTRGKA